MNRIRPLLVTATALAAAAFSPLRAAEPAPVAHWTFDAADASGAFPGENGKPAGVPAGDVKLTDGRFGQALEFGPDHGSVAIPAALDEFFGDGFTVSFWARFDGGAGEQPGGYSGIFSTNNFPHGLSIHFQQGTKVDVAARGAWHIANSQVQTPARSDFVHVAYVYDGVKGTLYADGTAYPEGDEQASNSGKYGTSLLLGARRTVNDQGVELSPEDYEMPLAGAIDDLRIYNFALSPDEITALEK